MWCFRCLSALIGCLLSLPAKFLRHVCLRGGHVDSGCLDPSSPARIPPEVPAESQDLNIIFIMIFINIFTLLFLTMNNMFQTVINKCLNLSHSNQFLNFIQSEIKSFYVVLHLSFQNKSILPLSFILLKMDVGSSSFFFSLWTLYKQEVFVCLKIKIKLQFVCLCLSRKRLCLFSLLCGLS